MNVLLGLGIAAASLFVASFIWVLGFRELQYDWIDGSAWRVALLFLVLIVAGLVCVYGVTCGMNVAFPGTEA